MTELIERLDVIRRLDAVIGSIKQRRRGHTGGQMLVGMAAAQLAGEDFLVGWTVSVLTSPVSSWPRCGDYVPRPRPGGPAGITASGRSARAPRAASSE